MTAEEREDWVGLIIGPYLVVEPFTNARMKSSYRSLHVELDKVVGPTARRLAKLRNQMHREGIEPVRVSVWDLALAGQRVKADTEARKAAAEASA